MPLLLRKKFGELIKQNIINTENFDLNELSKTISFQLGDLSLLKQKINSILNIGEKWKYILRFLGNLSLSRFCEIVFASHKNDSGFDDANHLSTNMQLFWNSNFYKVNL